MNEFADYYKNKGGLKVGDVLELPAGTTYTYEHGNPYGGTSQKTCTLSKTMRVRVTHTDYDQYSVYPLDDNNFLLLYQDGFAYLIKASEYCVINNDPSLKWFDFLVTETGNEES